MISRCNLNLKDNNYNVQIELDENLNFGLEFECLQSHDIYTYKECSKNIEKFTSQSGAGMDAGLFYNCVKTSIKDNLLGLSKPTPSTLCVTFHLICESQSLVRNIPITLLKRTRANELWMLPTVAHEISMRLLETIEDFCDIVTPDCSIRAKLSGISNRFEKVKVPCGPLAEKISAVKNRIDELIEQTVAPCTTKSKYHVEKGINRKINGPGGNLISLDRIDFQNSFGISGYVVDSFAYNMKSDGAQEIKHLLLRPTVSNKTSAVITLTTHHHLL